MYARTVPATPPPKSPWDEAESPTAKREIPKELREEPGPKTHATTKVDRAAIDALLAKTKERVEVPPEPAAPAPSNTIPAGPPDFEET